ncbi:hypothetical protein NGM07_25250 (plasmid) [Halorussus vallis]|uniref:hypothetical protein n=1 Tax=Halorussus vallis TaxID=2953749 RepID=UPI00209F514F|nr:hypothetical protein [Halorussus vallis]USZ78658.1 hypothetical protein NGM07_25250 [Halorussus vallis]
MATQHDATGESEYDRWLLCGTDSCTDEGQYSFQYYLLDDEGDVCGNGHVLYCPYHAAVCEREIRADPARELERICVLEETFDSWSPPRRCQPYNIDPELELKTLLDYLEAQDATTNPALVSRIEGIQAALTILREEDDMYGAVRGWQEPWKVDPGRQRP